MRESVPDQLVRVFARHAPPGRQIEPDRNLFEAGFTSTMLAAVFADLQALGLSLVPELRLIDLFRFPTINALGAELRRRRKPAARGGPPPVPWERWTPGAG